MGPPVSEVLMDDQTADLLYAVSDQLNVVLQLGLPDRELLVSQECRLLLSGLEVLLSALLRRKFDAREWESLDGILPARIRTSPTGLDIVGLAVLISDQSTTPIHVELKSEAGTIALFGQLGEPGSGELGLARVPYRGDGMFKEMQRAARRDPNDHWVHEVRAAAPLRERQR